jgi:hypothetical protein
LRSGYRTDTVRASPLPQSVIAHPRRRLALLTAVPVVVAALAALMVTVVGRSDNGPNSTAAIEAMSFIKENGADQQARCL